jgi:hypothetical protein
MAHDIMEYNSGRMEIATAAKELDVPRNTGCFKSTFTNLRGYMCMYIYIC